MTYLICKLITLESIPRTNQYYAIRVKFLAKKTTSVFDEAQIPDWPITSQPLSRFQHRRYLNCIYRIFTCYWYLYSCLLLYNTKVRHCYWYLFSCLSVKVRHCYWYLFSCLSVYTTKVRYCHWYLFSCLSVYNTKVRNCY